MFHRAAAIRSSAAAQQAPSGTRRGTLLNLCIWTVIYYAGFLTGMHSFLATNDNCSRKLSAALGIIEKPMLGVNDPETREMQRIVESVVQKSLAQGASIRILSTVEGFSSVSWVMYVVLQFDLLIILLCVCVCVFHSFQSVRKTRTHT